jgi:hypothetical protein
MFEHHDNDKPPIYGSHIPLRIGDYVVLRLSKPYDGYLSSPGLLDDNCFVTNDPDRFENCLWEIHVQNQYSSTKEYKEALLESKKNALIQLDDGNNPIKRSAKSIRAEKEHLAQLRRAALNEQRLNEKLMGLRKGKPIAFGDPLQLRHVKSQKFLTVSEDILAKEERENMRIYLESKGDSLSCVGLMPRYRFDKEGNVVTNNAEVMIKIHERVGEYLHAAKLSFSSTASAVPAPSSALVPSSSSGKLKSNGTSSQGNTPGKGLTSSTEQPFPSSKVIEVNSSLESSYWTVSLYQRVEDLRGNVIPAGSLVTLQEPESLCCLTIDRPVPLSEKGEKGEKAEKTTKGERPKVVMSSQYQLRDLRPGSVNVGTHLLWLIEKSDITVGGPISLETDEVTLRDLNSGYYMKLDDNNLLSNNAVNSSGEGGFSGGLTTVRHRSDATFFQLKSVQSTKLTSTSSSGSGSHTSSSSSSSSHSSPLVHDDSTVQLVSNDLWLSYSVNGSSTTCEYSLNKERAISFSISSSLYKRLGIHLYVGVQAIFILKMLIKQSHEIQHHKKGKNGGIDTQELTRSIRSAYSVLDSLSLFLTYKEGDSSSSLGDDEEDDENDAFNEDFSSSQSTNGRNSSSNAHHHAQSFLTKKEKFAFRQHMLREQGLIAILLDLLQLTQTTIFDNIQNPLILASRESYHRKQVKKSGIVPSSSGNPVGSSSSSPAMIATSQSSKSRLLFEKQSENEEKSDDIVLSSGGGTAVDRRSMLSMSSAGSNATARGVGRRTSYNMIPAPTTLNLKKARQSMASTNSGVNSNRSTIMSGGAGNDGKSSSDGESRGGAILSRQHALGLGRISSIHEELTDDENEEEEEEEDDDDKDDEDEDNVDYGGAAGLSTDQTKTTSYHLASRCLKVLYGMILYNPKNQLIVAENSFPILLSFVQEHSFAVKCIEELTNENLLILQTKVRQREIDIFIELLIQYEMSTTFLRLLQHTCSCPLMGVDATQRMVTHALFGYPNLLEPQNQLSLRVMPNNNSLQIRQSISARFAMRTPKGPDRYKEDFATKQKLIIKILPNREKLIPIPNEGWKDLSLYCPLINPEEVVIGYAELKNGLPELWLSWDMKGKDNEFSMKTLFDYHDKVPFHLIASAILLRKRKRLSFFQQQNSTLASITNSLRRSSKNPNSSNNRLFGTSATAVTKVFHRKAQIYQKKQSTVATPSQQHPAASAASSRALVGAPSKRGLIGREGSNKGSGGGGENVSPVSSLNQQNNSNNNITSTHSGGGTSRKNMLVSTGLNRIQVGEYFTTQLYLVSDLCLDRNYIAMILLESLYPYDILITILMMASASTVNNNALGATSAATFPHPSSGSSFSPLSASFSPSSSSIPPISNNIKAAVCRIIRCLYVDREPQIKAKFPRFIRTATMIMNKPRITTMNQQIMSVELSNSSGPFSSNPNRSEQYKFALIQLIISDYINHSLDLKNCDELSAEMICLLQSLVSFSFYHTIPQILDILKPLVKILDHKRLSDNQFSRFLDYQENSDIDEGEGGSGGGAGGDGNEDTMEGGDQGGDGDDEVYDTNEGSIRRRKRSKGFNNYVSRNFSFSLLSSVALTPWNYMKSLISAGYSQVAPTSGHLSSSHDEDRRLDESMHSPSSKASAAAANHAYLMKWAVKFQIITESLPWLALIFLVVLVSVILAIIQLFDNQGFIEFFIFSTIFFLFEIIIRIGIHYILENYTLVSFFSYGLNVLDVLLVVLDIELLITTEDSQPKTVTRILRILRLIRFIRIIKAYREMRQISSITKPKKIWKMPKRYLSIKKYEVSYHVPIPFPYLSLTFSFSSLPGVFCCSPFFLGLSSSPDSFPFPFVFLFFVFVSSFLGKNDDWNFANLINVLCKNSRSNT